jgi:hypothetical protein
MHAFILEDRNKDFRKWRFTVQRSDYNHSFIAESGSHSAIRKIHKDDKFKAKIAIHQSAGMLARHTYITYEIKRPEVCIIMRDLYNARDKLKREKMGNKLFIHVLIEAFSLFNDKTRLQMNSLPIIL